MGGLRRLLTGRPLAPPALPRAGPRHSPPGMPGGRSHLRNRNPSPRRGSDSFLSCSPFARYLSPSGHPDHQGPGRRRRTARAPGPDGRGTRAGCEPLPCFGSSPPGCNALRAASPPSRAGGVGPGPTCRRTAVQRLTPWHRGARGVPPRALLASWPSFMRWLPRGSPPHRPSRPPAPSHRAGGPHLIGPPRRRLAARDTKTPRRPGPGSRPTGHTSAPRSLGPSAPRPPRRPVARPPAAGRAKPPSRAAAGPWRTPRRPSGGPTLRRRRHG